MRRRTFVFEKMGANGPITENYECVYGLIIPRQVHEVILQKLMKREHVYDLGSSAVATHL